MATADTAFAMRDDERGEVWDGVFHVSPMPSSAHQRFARGVFKVLDALATARGWEALYEIGVYEPGTGDSNYRGPDIAIVAPNHVTHRGIEGRAELVVEILSPNDESRQKLGFYARCTIPELWLIDPVTRVAEIYVLRDGAYAAVAPDARGVIHAPRFGLDLEIIAGPKLRIGSIEI